MLKIDLKERSRIPKSDENMRTYFLNVFFSEPAHGDTYIAIR